MIYPMPFLTLFIDNDSGNEEEIQVNEKEFTGPWTHSHVIDLTAIINISDTTDIANGIKWIRTLKLKCYIVKVTPTSNFTNFVIGKVVLDSS